MTAREKLNDGGGAYFASPKSNLDLVPTGCTLLDCALGGGWVEGRIANIIGDKSTGKTLLCIEAAANFIRKHPNGLIKYREAEAAFDEDYAAALGMPVDKVEFLEDPMETVEDFFEDLTRVVETKRKNPTLYILDSLDALSDRSELKRDMDDGTYGTQKAKLLSQLFRRLVRQIQESNVTVIIVSQIRSKIGVSFGKTTTRTGGRALDFYASQVVELSQLGVIKRTINKIQRPVGIEIKAKVIKNKVSLPFREAVFEIEFGYGIDDEKACRDWLKEVGGGPPGSLTDSVRQRWQEIETTFLPTRRKYGD